MLLSICCLYIYIRLVMSSYLLFCCTRRLFWCLVYHMLSKTSRDSRSLHRVIAYICYIYFDVWCTTCCWGISAMLAGSGVRFHTAAVFLIQTVAVVVACIICIHGFFRCRGYWIWVFCCLFVVCVYIFYKRFKVDTTDIDNNTSTMLLQPAC